MPVKNKNKNKDIVDYYGNWYKGIDKNSLSYYRLHNKVTKPIFDNYIQFISIDPGTINFALRISRLYPDRYENVKMIVINLPKDDTLKFNTLYDEFDKYLDLILKTHYIFIEKQLSYINKIATRVCAHTTSYFMIKLKNSKLYPHIIEVSSKLKTKILNMPKYSEGMTSSQKYTFRKKWCVEKALIISEKMGDLNSKNIILNSKKKDDLSDTVCQEYVMLLVLHILDDSYNIDLSNNISFNFNIKNFNKINLISY